MQLVCDGWADLSTTKSTMSSKTSSVISCLDQAGNKQLARPTLTLGASQDKDHQQQLSTMLQVQAAGGHHQEQHFITSLQVHNNGGGGNNNNIILPCSSVCSSGALPSANGEVSDQNTTTTNNGNGNGNGNGGSSSNMHNLFEVDFM